MVRQGRSLRRWNPLPIVIGVVVAVLAIQSVAAIAVSLAAQSDAETASRDIATLVGDSYAERAVVVLRPASSTAGTLAEQAAEGTLELDQTETVARELYAFMRAHPPFTSIGVRDGEGAWVMVRRVRDGYQVAGLTSQGEEFSHGYDASFARWAAIPPLRPGPSVANAPWVDEVEQSKDPVWINPGQGAANEEAVVAVGANGTSGPALAAVGIAVRAIGEQVSSGGSGDIADAYLLTSDRTVLAVDRAGPLPDGLPTAAEAGLVDTSAFLASGLGVVGTADERVVYERPLGLVKGPEWTVYVAVEPAGIVPGIAAMPQNMLLYSLLIVGLVVMAGLALWALSAPLAEMAARARTDQLTGLANRHEFDSRGGAVLEEASRRKSEVVVIAIDLDNFKRINDEVSHEAGDSVLRACAAALEVHRGNRDLVARVGGDEFAVLHWLGRGEEPGQMVEKLRAATERDMVSGVADASLTGLSAGFSLASAHRYRLEAAFNAADLALVEGRRVGKGATYAAKSSGGAGGGAGAGTGPAEDAEYHL